MGIDVPAQVRYWMDGAAEDLDTADVLLEKGKVPEGLFFAHLALEKAIKGQVVEATGDIPPKSHNLLRLAQLAGLEVDSRLAEFLGVMMSYHLEGRYPDSRGEAPAREKAREYVDRCKEVVKWLAEQ